MLLNFMEKEKNLNLMTAEKICIYINKRSVKKKVNYEKRFQSRRKLKNNIHIEYFVTK